MTASREGGTWVPSRDVAASAASAAVYSLALGVASVALPLLALHAGYSAAEIGLLTALSAIAQIVTRLGLGAAMRRWPDWTLVAGAGLLLALSSGLVAVSAALMPFVMAQLLQGMSRACFWTGSQTHVVRGPARPASALATVNLAAGVGLLAGPAVAGLLSERTPVLALAAAAGIALAGVLPTLLLDRLPPFVPPSDRPPGRLWRRAGVDIGCWAGVTAGAWRGLLTSYVPVALDAARQSASTIGVLVSAANGASLLGAALGGRLRRRWSTSAVALGIVATGLATAATTALAHSAMLCALVLIVSGLAAGAIQVLGPALATEAVHPEERGEAIAVTGTFRAGALFTAPLAVAGLVTLVPLASAIAVVGVAMTLPAFTVLHRRPIAPGGAPQG
jgi:MFS family permease